MKIRNLIVLSLIGLFIGMISCRDDFDFDPVRGQLSFSSDTVNLDTIFTKTNSQTYQVTVYNHENKDLEIPKIFLGKGETSLFKLNVDGMPGFEFTDVPIRKNDSILIFVEIAAGDIAANQHYEDDINFEGENNFQSVKLLSYLERAKFYNTEEQDDYVLSETDWDNQYARVVFGNITANDLNIGPNTRIYFHKDAGLTVNGTLTVNGDYKNEVLFRTDRRDVRSDSLPKLWNGIKIKSNNSNAQNSINYAIIKGGIVGLEVENSNLDIKNTKILNHDDIGLYGINSVLRGENVIVSNADLASLAIEGGDVEFIHSTFANYFNIGSGIGTAYSLFLGNVGNNEENIPLTRANFYNCIFYGRASNALFFEEGSSEFNFDFQNNIIKLNFPEELPELGSSNLTDEDPLFVEPGFGKNDVRLTTESPAAGWGNMIYANQVPLDIIKDSRTNSPTPGAYQNLVEVED